MWPDGVAEQCLVVAVEYRTENGRLEVVGGLPDKAQVVAATGPGFVEGRSARIVGEAGR